MSQDDLVILDRIYSVAIEPERYLELLETWEKRRHALQAESPGIADAGFKELLDQRFQSHIERAGYILESMVEQKVSLGRQLALEVEKARNISFLTGPDLVLRAASPGAAERLGLATGESLRRMNIEKASLEALSTAIREVCQQGKGASRLIRLPMSGRDRVIVMDLRALPEDGKGAIVALAVTSEFSWPQRLGDSLRSLFGLSEGEAEVARELTLGHSVTEIAALRDRSVNTVRTQARIVLQKMGLSSTVELVRTVLGMMDLVGTDTAGAEKPGTSRRNDYKTLPLRDGRRFDYLTLGAEGGRPFLWLPNTVGLYRWTREAERHLEKRGLRMIVPVRAGYGASSPAPKDQGSFETAAKDILTLLDHLAIRELPVVSLGLDFCLAMHMVAAASHRISAVLACGPMMPLYDAAHLERLHIWQRFMSGNARFTRMALPFLVNAGFLLAQRLGKKKFVQSIYGNSTSDLAALERPEILEAILLGSEPVLSETFSAHRAFANDMIAMSDDWSYLLEQRQVPVKIFCGTEDAGAPIVSVREVVAAFPHLGLRVFEGQGKLLPFTHWREIIEEIEAVRLR